MNATINKRELVRNPARLSTMKPGDIVTIPDAQGDYLVRRKKGAGITLAQMDSDLAAICKGWPKTDALAMMEDES